MSDGPVTKEQLLAELRQMLAELDEAERGLAAPGAAAREGEQPEDITGQAAGAAHVSLLG